MFDPVQKTLLADQGEIRVGCKYQAEIPDRLAEGKQQERLASGLSNIGLCESCALELDGAVCMVLCCDHDRIRPQEPGKGRWAQLGREV